MSNIGGLEIIMVLLVALIVLGPTKLPDAARQLGKAVTELRRISSGFQRELREAIQDPIIEAEARARGAVESAKKQAVEPFTKASQPAQSTTPLDAEGAEMGTSDRGPAGNSVTDNSTDDNSVTDNSTDDNSVTDNSTDDNSTADDSVTDNSPADDD